MREVEWVEEGALGAPDTPTRGTLTELLVGGPYPSLSPPEIPPLVVVNEMISSPGGGGMNGGRRWTPFAVDDGDYRELVGDLVGAHGFTLVEVPAWVTSCEDWHVWLWERRWGVPSEQHRHLRARARDLARQFEQARTEPATSPGRLAELFLAAKRAQDDAEHFGDAWMTAPQYANYRRTRRWMLDAHHRRQAAEMVGDEDAAAAAADQAARLGERCSPTRPDEQWSAAWEDWPDYPPAECQP